MTTCRPVIQDQHLKFNWTPRALLLAFLLSILGIQMVKAQNLIHYFTVNDGLPSSEVYYVHQDFDGYIWFCTDRGVSRYNGYEFENFTSNDGLTFNTVFKIMEDEEHNLWFTCFDGSLFIRDYKSQEFVEFPLNRELKELLGPYGWIEAIGFEKDSIKFFPHSLGNGNTVLYDLEKKVLSPLQEPTSNPVHLEYGKLNSLSKIIFKIDEAFAPSFLNVMIKGNGEFELSPDSILKDFSSFRIDYQEQMDNSTKRFFEAIDYYDSLRVLCTKNGVELLFANGLKAHLLGGIATTGSEMDEEGNLWVSTLKGVYVYKLLNMEMYDLSSMLDQGEKITAMNTFQNHVLVGTNNGTIVDTERRLPVYKNAEDWNYIHFLSKSDNELSYSPSDGRVVSVSLSTEMDSMWVIRKAELPDRWPYYLRLGISENEHFQFGPSWHSYYRNEELVYYLYERVYHACLRDTSAVYYSTSSDLFLANHFNIEAPLRLTEQVGSQNATIRRLVYSKDSILLICTSGKGLILSKGDTVWANINKENGLPSDIVNSCYIDPENRRIWCATNKGLSIIDYAVEGQSFQQLSITHVCQAHGLPSNSIHEIVATDNRVWLAFDQAVVSLKKNFIIPSIKAPDIVVSVFKNGAEYTLDSIPIFPYDQNNIEIGFWAMSVNKPSQGRFYRYRLLRNGETDSDWVYTNEREARLKNLAAGNYSFEVYAKSEDSQWSTPEIITFTIKPYFFDRTEVRVILLLLILAAIVSGLGWWTRSVNKRNEKNIELKELQLANYQLELATLRGQMNPHFVFNALQSIQKLILEGGKWEANKLLGRFAKLIRASLEYSRIDFIELEKEVSYLENYLQIEKRRTPEKFNYSFEIDEDINDLMIPTLLIQPICENAIKHAFNKSHGVLMVKIKPLTKDTIKVEIIDDGIGYFNVSEQRKSTRHSTGMKIVKSRLELFAKQGYATLFSIKPLNLADSKGTVVTLHLPCK